jgi:GAF domain-containing protein
VTSRADRQRGALDAIDRFVNSEPTAERVVQRTVELLEERFEHYSWVGVYFVEDNELVLGPWQGPQPTQHDRIPVGQGICGAAAASGATEVVDDVSTDERYLRCFPWTRSEIVVPIRFGGEIVGEIDVDSENPAAFDEQDVQFLEHVARMISSRCRN